MGEVRGGVLVVCLLAAGAPMAAQSGVAQVAAGGPNTMVVRADGAVRAWGLNDSGGLGDGTGVERSRPVCALIGGVRAVSVSASHTLAVRQDGSVWAWGNGGFGLLGDGSVAAHVAPSPAAVAGLSGVTAVASGYFHSLALKSDGTVWAWGGNASGELGDGSNVDRAVPAQVAGLSGIVAVAAGRAHSVALRNDGAVFAWGANAFGQVGDGSTVDRAAPVRVPGVSARAVAASDAQTVVVLTSGRVWGWGETAGLGLDLTVLGQIVAIPLKLVDFPDVAQVATARGLTVLTRADGSVWYLGTGLSGRYGGGLVDLAVSPMALPLAAAGVAVGSDQVFVLLSDGTVRGLGGNSNGELGRTDIGSSDVFVAPEAEAACTGPAVSPLTVAPRVSMGRGQTLVVRQDGSVWGAGANDTGQLGNGSTAAAVVHAVRAGQLTGMVGVSTRAGHSLAVGADGRVWSWGDNGFGQLGDGTVTDRTSPVQVVGLDGVTRVAAGGGHSLALRGDGSVWAWGSNGNGAVGNPLPFPQVVAAEVPGLTGVVDVAAGDDFSVALRGDGTVWRWGLQVGQAGGGWTADAAPVEGLSNVVAIAAGGTAAVALKGDGTVWMWGEGALRRMGSGPSAVDATGLVRVSELTGMVAIGAADTHFLAVAADGTVWAWGVNDVGQLGTGGATALEPPLAAQVPQLYGAALVGGGTGFSGAWLRDGRLMMWGANAGGAFGLSAPTLTAVPVQSGFQAGYPVGSTPAGTAPSGGSGPGPTFDAAFHSEAGLQWAQMLVATAEDGGGAPYCLVHYDVLGDGLWLYGDGGFFVGPVAPGVGSNLLQNAFCAVDPAASSVSAAGTELVLHARLVFKQAGARNVYLRSMDTAAGDSGWIQAGTWTAAAAPLATAAVSPNAGSGGAPVFTLTYTEQAGLPATVGGWVQFLVAAAADGGGQPFCFLHYDRGGNGLWMYSGDVGFFVGPAQPGAVPGVLQSSACGVNAAGTTVSNASGVLTVGVPVTLKAPMKGSRKLFQRSLDALGRDTGWSQTGSWVVP